MDLSLGAVSGSDSEARVACALQDGPPRKEAARFASLTAIPKRGPDVVAHLRRHLDFPRDLRPTNCRIRESRA